MRGQPEHETQAKIGAYGWTDPTRDALMMLWHALTSSRYDLVPVWAGTLSIPGKTNGEKPSGCGARDSTRIDFLMNYDNLSSSSDEAVTILKCHFERCLACADRAPSAASLYQLMDGLGVLPTVRGDAVVRCARR